MAEDVTPRPERLPEPTGGEREPERLPDVRVEDATAEVAWPTKGMPPSTYAPRFRMLTGALVGVALGALAATALLGFGRGPAPEISWSPWQPSEKGSDGAEQVARHVGPQYRLATGDQLVLVTGGPLKVADLDLPVRIALASGSGGSEEVSEVKGKTVLYTLCGLGPRCSINKGKASTERFLLLRREALELALYSFRYLGIKNVVTLLPPAPGKKPENALFFRKRDFESTLDRPLAATLPNPPPTIASMPDSPEAPVVAQLTDSRLFSYSFQQSQDLSAFLILSKRRQAAR